MRIARLFPLLALATLTFPFVGADHAPTDCPFARSSPDVDAGGRYYVFVHESAPITWTRIQVWSESNHVPGLQTSPTPCAWDEPAWPADRLVTTIGGPIPL